MIESINLAEAQNAVNACKTIQIHRNPATPVEGDLPLAEAQNAVNACKTM